MKHSVLLTDVALSIAIALGVGVGASAGQEEQPGDRAASSSARQRPAMPEITEPVMFNTPQADRILAALLYLATHHASSKTDPNLPRMGERFRLRQDFDVAGFSPHIQAILKGLKKFGMFVTDNGGDWRISVAPDSRIKGLDELRKVKGTRQG